MSKEFARAFYDSKAWKQMREFYREYVHGLCEVCGNPGEIVHHIRPLTPENIDDPSVTLGMNNLQLLCRSCHQKWHNAAEPNGLTHRCREYFFDQYGDVHPTE